MHKNYIHVHPRDGSNGTRHGDRLMRRESGRHSSDYKHGEKQRQHFCGRRKKCM